MNRQIADPRTLIRFRLGRIVLHLMAMRGDRAFRFHAAGIVRELPFFHS